MSYEVYSADPVLPLRDSTGAHSIIKLERVLTLTADAGQGPSFDAMLGRWVGDAGVTNGFRLKDIPEGTFNLYLYAGQVVGQTTTFYVSVNGQPYSIQYATPTGGASFVAGDNYALFGGLSLTADSVVDIRVIGRLAGLQLRRIT